MSRPQLRPPALQAAVAASSPLLLGIAGCAVTRARGHWRDRSLCGKKCGRVSTIAMVAVTIAIIVAVAIAIAIAIIVAIATITVTEIDNALDN